MNLKFSTMTIPLVSEFSTAAILLRRTPTPGRAPDPEGSSEKQLQ